MSGLAWWVTPNRVRKFSHDESCYIGLAQSLAAGRGYVFDDRPHTQYPPGYPAALAPVVTLFGSDPPIIAHFNAILAVAGLFLTYGFFRRRSASLAPVLLALVALSPLVYRFAADEPMSEMLYLTASMAFLWWAEQAPGGARPGVRIGSLAVGALLLCLTVTTRTIGAGLVASGFATLLHERWRRGSAPASGEGARTTVGLVVPLAAATVAVVAWVAWSASAAQPLYRGEFMPPYTEQALMVNPHQPDLGAASFATLVGRVPEMLILQLAHVSEILTSLPWVAPLWYSPLIALVALVVGLGWWTELQRPRPLAAWYLACYGGILLFWPFDEGKRFLLPVLPLLLWMAWSGALVLRRALAVEGPRRAQSAGAVAGCAAAILLLAWVTAGSEDGSRQHVAALVGWAAVALLALLVATQRLRSAAISVVVTLALGAVVSLSVGLGVRQTLREAAANLAADPDAISHTGASRAARWLDAHSAPGDVIMAGDYAAIHFATGRRTVRLPISGQAALLREALAVARPRFLVIIDPPAHPYYLPVEPERFAVLERGDPGRFVLREAFDGGRIYEVR